MFGMFLLPSVLSVGMFLLPSVLLPAWNEHVKLVLWQPS